MITEKTALDYVPILKILSEHELQIMCGNQWRDCHELNWFHETKFYRRKPTQEPPIIAEQESGNSFISAVKTRLESAKEKHRASASCEFPRTCGACHYYSGYIQALTDFLEGTISANP